MSQVREEVRANTLGKQCIQLANINTMVEFIQCHR